MTRQRTVLLLTAPGVSAIAVIRLRGPDVGNFLRNHFRGTPRTHAPVHGRLIDGDKELDDPVVLWDPARETADICTHGGRWVVHSVLELAKREGFTEIHGDDALPLDAVDADDVLEQEILRYLPLAATREAIQTLLNQRQAWRDLESQIPDPKSQILSDRSLHWLLHPPRIAIIGIPNAGKSTLANALLGRQHSIVSDTPGTTRDYVEALADLSGLAVHLVDTPGLRLSEDRIEMAAIGISHDQIEKADLQILLLDPTQPTGKQLELAGIYPHAMRVLTKSDTRCRFSDPSLTATLRISATTGIGLSELDLAIGHHFGCDTLPHNRPCIWTQRQREWILAHLNER